MADRKRYTDEQRAEALAALAANGGNVGLTARQLGIPDPTLRCWARGDRHPEALQMHEGKKVDLADALETVAHQLIGAMPGKIGSASLQQVAVSMGISIEKMRLLREQPTSIPGKAEPDLGHLTNEQLTQLDVLLAAVGFAIPDRNGALPP